MDAASGCGVVDSAAFELAASDVLEGRCGVVLLPDPDADADLPVAVAGVNEPLRVVVLRVVRVLVPLRPVDDPDPDTSSVSDGDEPSVVVDASDSSSVVEAPSVANGSEPSVAVDSEPSVAVDSESSVVEFSEPSVLEAPSESPVVVFSDSS